MTLFLSIVLFLIGAALYVTSLGPVKMILGWIVIGIAFTIGFGRQGLC